MALRGKRLWPLLCVIVFLYAASNVLLDAISVSNHAWKKSHKLSLVQDLYARITRPGVTPEAAANLGLGVLRTTCKEVKRFGHASDGGWDVCTDNIDFASCIVYSVGIKDDTSFDEAMVAAGCKVFAFDPTIGRATGDDLGKGIEFFAWKLAASSDDSFYQSSLGTRWPNVTTSSLGGFMHRLGHTHVDILKMDVEGYEWQILEQWARMGFMGTKPTACPPFNMLMAELHFDAIGPTTLAGHIGRLRELRAAGFEPYSLRENWRYCDIRSIQGVELFGCVEMGWTLDTRRRVQCQEKLTR